MKIHSLILAASISLLSAGSAQAECFPQFGTDGPDTIVADPGCDAVLVGLGGSDTLIGGDGWDVLWGDALSAGDGLGGNGADILTGGAGFDAFGFNRAAESRGNHIDTITDFTPGEDVIAMAGVCFHAHHVDCSFIGTAAFDGTPGEVRDRVAYLPLGVVMTIITADLDGDQQIDFTVYLIGNLQLSASDFLFTGYPPNTYFRLGPDRKAHF